MDIALIVGLGNPGPEYAATRHNVGFWFLDALAGQETRYSFAAQLHCLLARLTLYGHDCRLLKPTTFMNRSGQAVEAVAGFFKIPAEQILVVHDDLDLPPGIARLKHGGGHGGHNGLRDIHAHLGSNQFFRLRLGIGHPGVKELVTPYVLARPTREEQEAIESSIQNALQVLPWVTAGELQKAMHQLHSQR